MENIYELLVMKQKRERTMYSIHFNKPTCEIIQWSKSKPCVCLFNRCTELQPSKLLNMPLRCAEFSPLSSLFFRSFLFFILLFRPPSPPPPFLLCKYGFYRPLVGFCCNHLISFIHLFLSTIHYLSVTQPTYLF